MQGPLRTSPTSSQGGALIPFFALGALGSSYPTVPLSDTREGLRADQWQLLLNQRMRKLVYYSEINRATKTPMEECILECFKKKKKSVPLEQGHYTSILNTSQNCLKWFSKI